MRWSPMRALPLLALPVLAAAVTLTACGGRGSSSSIPAANVAGAAGTGRNTASAQQPAPTAPPDAPGHTNTLPSPPPAGASLTGAIYSIFLTASTGDTVSLTVFAPSTITGGATYPLVLHGHGWGGSRTKTLGSPAARSSASVSARANPSGLVAHRSEGIRFHDPWLHD